MSVDEKKQKVCRGCLTMRGLKDAWFVCGKCKQGYCDPCVRGAAQQKVCWLPDYGETRACGGKLVADDGKA